MLMYLVKYKRADWLLVRILFSQVHVTMNETTAWWRTQNLVKIHNSCCCQTMFW